MKKILLAGAFLFATCSLQAQWVAQPSNITSGYDVQFIDAVNPTVCWGLVADPVTQTNPVQEFTRTIDGTNWVDGVISNAVGLCPSGISAINADTAWVAMFNPVAGGQGRILLTNDGGATWTWQSTALFSATGNFPDFVYFWNANNGVCLGDPTGGFFEIYTTTNGGTIWTATPSANIAPILAGEFGITSVFTTYGDSTIWFGTNKGRIYKSTNKGLNWSAYNTPFTNLYIGAIAFRDANHGLAVAGSAPGSSDIARTTDGGVTWNLIGTNAAGITLMQGLTYLPGSDSTYFISTPYAGSVDGTTFSPNDGTSWLPVDNLIHTSIDFVNDSVGWTGSNELNAPMFKWSTPVTVPATDALTQSIDVTLNTGMVAQFPKATVKNNGLNNATFNVTMTITGGYSSTQAVTGLAFNATSQVTFASWTPATTGSYTIKVYTSLASDLNHPNDTMTTSVNVFEAFENYGWVSKPNVGAGTFGLAGAFNLLGTTSSSDGTLYSIGGADFTIIHTTNNAFGTMANTWGNADTMPSTKYQFSAQRVGKKIICSGGYSAGFVPDANTYIYDITGNIWSTGSPMPVPVGDYASGVYGDSLIYYIGGYNGTADVNSVQVYHVSSDSWTTSTIKPGTACAGLRGSINGNTIVLAGGYSQTLATEISDAYKGVINPGNPSQITWTTLPAYPGGTIGRFGAGTVFMDFKPLIIFAGGDPTGAGTAGVGDCWGYDVAQDKWLIGTSKTTPVSNISDLVGLIYNDSLWMASVAGYDGINISNVHEWLNLGAYVWTGIKENQLPGANSIVLYPNPANSQLTVLIGDDNSSLLTITDVSGRIVKKESINKGQKTLSINISPFDAGLYFITLMSADGAKTNAKFVKE